MLLSDNFKLCVTHIVSVGQCSSGGLSQRHDPERVTSPLQRLTFPVGEVGIITAPTSQIHLQLKLILAQDKCSINVGHYYY